ncbi:sodium-dependent transporter [Sporosarcina sp. P13]|uniref:sodium-dependent transporter n=1 Tax=Sporosarcina sp. P13 TaxID=2048263 RepID=UPI000C16C79D|nr:sodium-dependent transporter [Sporosarcina sp. P13]PIC63372.1 sodium-dependent transporter [Sporosarcina sp. P13]
MKKSSAGYSTQLGLVITLIAGSVGLGNIWRFPRIAAENGGGTFIVAWAIMMILVCLPIMLGEHSMGRATRHGLPGAFKDFIGSKYTWMGITVTIMMFALNAYYTVLTGWVVYYLGLSITNGYKGEDKAVLFDTVSGGNYITVLIFVALISLACYIAYKGIKGIEKVSKVFLPILFISLAIVAIYSITLPGSSKGLNYLFSFDPTLLFSSKIWLEALTQAVWSAGAGWGLVITLAVFTKSKSDLSLTTSIQVAGDGMVALLAGMAVVPAVFAMAPTIEAAEGILTQGNFGLTFISLTNLFEQMPGGYYIGVLFFLSLALAAFSSVIASVMIVILPLADSGVSKKKAILWTYLILIVWGLPSAWNPTFLSNQDWIVGQMMVFGAFLSCFALYKFGVSKVRKEFINNPYTGMPIGKWWEYSIKYIAPVIIVIMFVWWSVQSIGWDDQWWNPFAALSLGTLILQGGLMLLISIIFNNRVSDSIQTKHYIGNGFPEIPKNDYSE